MRSALLLLLALPAPAATLAKSPLHACLKWSKDAPEAQAAGEDAFASFLRVEGAGPWKTCDVVAVVEDFGVGWFMRAYMKPAVMSACGERLGGYTFHYKGDAWQRKLVSGLSDWAAKNPRKLKDAKPCEAAASSPAPAPPASVPEAPAPVPDFPPVPLEAPKP